MMGAGGKRGMALQIISLILTLVGILGGLFLSLHQAINSKLLPICPVLGGHSTCMRYKSDSNPITSP